MVKKILFAKRNALSKKTTTEPSKKILKKAKTPKKTFTVTYDEFTNMIQVRAYELYTTRDYNTGDQMSDWLNAERQVTQELTTKYNLNIIQG